jgi:polyisoprenoid-binding protein YceI
MELEETMEQKQATQTSVGPKPAAQQVSWEIDPLHSAAHFSVRHMMISNVHGEFKLTGSVSIDAKEFRNSSVEALIDASMIDTREPARDDHLRSADFFDVQKFPSLIFRSTRIEGSPDAGFTLSGKLTIHGVTREVTFEVEPLSPETKDPYGNVRIGTSARTKIDRKDFGLHWNAALETGGVLVGTQVNITLEIELIKKAA